MNDALRQVMRAAQGAGRLGADAGHAAASSDGGECGSTHPVAPAGEGEGADTPLITGRAEHPVCGDVVEVDLRLSGTVVHDLAWRARGCPATMAVAAAAHAALVGQPLDRAAELLRQRLHSLGGLARAEQHAFAVFLDALRDAATRR